MYSSVVFVVLVSVSVALGTSSWMDRSYGYCVTVVKGFPTVRARRFPEIEIPPDSADVNFSIPNSCSEWGVEMWGCVVMACDPDRTPSLTVRKRGVGGAVLHRRGRLSQPAHVYIEQYCAW